MKHSRNIPRLLPFAPPIRPIINNNGLNPVFSRIPTPAKAELPLLFPGQNGSPSTRCPSATRTTAVSVPITSKWFTPTISDFMCCNAQLEETMHQAHQHLVNSIPNFHRCNIQRISNTVQVPRCLWEGKSIRGLDSLDCLPLSHLPNDVSTRASKWSRG